MKCRNKTNKTANYPKQKEKEEFHFKKVILQYGDFMLISKEDKDKGRILEFF